MSQQISEGSSLTGISVLDLSAAIKTNRNCTIQITNHTNESLSDPNTYCNSGYCYSPPQPIIEGRTRDACSFSKAADAATGSVGVLSYRLGNSNMRIALMFSVPYDFNLYSSWFGLAFMDASLPTNEALYKEMYYGKEHVDMPDQKRAKAKDGITLHVEKGDWKISATMSEAKRSIIHVEITNKGHPHHQGPNYGGWNVQ